MPSSTWHNMETFVALVRELAPASFLDIGVGFGKWGFLFREYTDIWNKRFVRAQWRSVLHGIEVYEPYITENAHQRAIYDEIFIGDATDVIDRLGPYDFIYAGDVLEHIEKQASVTLLRKLIAKAKMTTVCSIPLGTDWLCTRNWDNSHEDHVSSWDLQELREYGFTHYNITPDPANASRKVGFFVHSTRKIDVAGLVPLQPRWFGRRATGL